MFWTCLIMGLAPSGQWLADAFKITTNIMFSPALETEKKEGKRWDCTVLRRNLPICQQNYLSTTWKYLPRNSTKSSYKSTRFSSCPMYNMGTAQRFIGKVNKRNLIYAPHPIGRAFVSRVVGVYHVGEKRMISIIIIHWCCGMYVLPHILYLPACMWLLINARWFRLSFYEFPSFHTDRLTDY